MTRPAPPRFATWLLQRFAFGPHAQSLVGDIVELYQHGQSATWYWCQAAATAFVGTAAFIRAYSRRTLRQLGLGVSVLWYLSSSTQWFISGVVGLDWLSLSVNLAVLGYCSVGFILLILTITRSDDPPSLLLVEAPRVASTFGAPQRGEAE